MSTADVVRARIDSRLKKEATEVLAAMGLSISDLIRMTLTRVAAEKALPFDLRVPNAASEEALEDLAKGRTRRVDTVDALMADLNRDDEG